MVLSSPILVVEDSQATRDAICFLLDGEGYRVARAVDGRDAMEQLTRGLSPSLILLDLAMPRMDGFAFRAWQVGDRRFAAIPVVACSGALDVDRAEDALGVPALRKPHDVDRLLDLVATHAHAKPASRRAVKA
jgi:two-component system response regulator MprA